MAYFVMSIRSNEIPIFEQAAKESGLPVFVDEGLPVFVGKAPRLSDPGWKGLWCEGEGPRGTCHIDLTAFWQIVNCLRATKEQA